MASEGVASPPWILGVQPGSHRRGLGRTCSRIAGCCRPAPTTHVPRPLIWGPALALPRLRACLFGPWILGRLCRPSCRSSRERTPQAMTWSLEWWPGRIHGYDSVLYQCWAPCDYSTARTTSIPRSRQRCSQPRSLSPSASALARMSLRPQPRCRLPRLRPTPSAASSTYRFHSRPHRRLASIVSPRTCSGRRSLAPQPRFRSGPFRLDRPACHPLPARHLPPGRWPVWALQSSARSSSAPPSTPRRLAALRRGRRLIVAYATAAAPRRSIPQAHGWLALGPGLWSSDSSVPAARPSNLVQRRPPAAVRPDATRPTWRTLVRADTTVLGADSMRCFG